MRSAPSEPPETRTTRRPGLDAELGAGRGWRRGRSMASTSGRTGLPVTTARGSGVSGNETAHALANRPAKRLAAPGRAFCSATTIGTRRTTAARVHGTLA